MDKEKEKQEYSLVGGDDFCSENAESCCCDCDGKTHPFDFDVMDSELENLAYKAFKTGIITATVVGVVVLLALKGVRHKRKTKAMRFTIKH